MKYHHDHSISCHTVEQAKELLQTLGWAVLSPELVADRPEPLLKQFGSTVPQYDGNLQWEVRPAPGFEKVPYSQSKNGIGAHTEAPVYSPPPKYVVLHCRRQARCGGGQTMLADGLQFCKEHGGLQRFRQHEVTFVAAPSPGRPGTRVTVPLLTSHHNDPVFRFSYNLFKYGDVNPSEDALVDPQTALNRDFELVELANAAEEFFDRSGIAVLVPDGAALIWDNHRLMHSRSRFDDPQRHLTRYWLSPQ
ncbi:branched-chain amino acid aminotransferase [Azotobacter chroococcum]|uniref:TauD/TfdA family dioxygenase n=1 Tax=Azotobacter chroococcum TaxID=353 RepID=UPI00103B641C|nr:TauD/TfdA family dioxygenase [Azotobacter chroococcum]TBW33999.1 branched-chain amino acid aminotransferase [Azotobacter chroococcum]